tara:strand:- start:961 stop:2193 length:1233 start_codon:yes stop_codon:yes gene_type:complete
MKKYKKILIVTHQYLPHVSPRTTRWKLLVDELITKGHKVTILTGMYPDFDKNNVEILYFGNKNNINIVSNLRAKSKQVSSGDTIKKLFFGILKKIYRFFINYLAWPDYSMYWLYQIYKNKSHISKDYDVIVSVSLPFSSHIAAYLINKKVKKHWIMDIGDPFSLKVDAPENNRFLYSGLNKRYEKKFYSLADNILFTHQDALSNHMKFFDIPSNKLIVANPISNFDKDLFNNALSYDYSSRPIKISYFGIFTKGVRSPNSFLELVKKNNEFEFSWYVNEDSEKIIKSCDINEDKHSFYSHVPRVEAQQLMVNSAHCLLSIGNKNPNQIPSKVIEYLATGKPIIHFTEIDDDPVIKLSVEFDNLITINKNDEKENLNLIIEEMINKIEKYDIDKFINNYTAESIINNLDVF